MEDDNYKPRCSSTNFKRQITPYMKLTNHPKFRIIILVTVTLFVLGYVFTSFSNDSNDTHTHPISENDHFRYNIPKCGKKISHNDIRSTILEAFYDGVSPYEDFPPAHIAHLLQPRRLDGWGSNAAVFGDLIRKLRPQTIIEIGTFLGASATHMAGLTKELGLDTQILCLDDFRGWAAFRDLFKTLPMQNANVMLLPQFMQNVITLNSSDIIIPIPFATASGLDRLCQLGVEADLIEIDAGHDFHSAWDDINHAYKLLRPGGVMFGHDYTNRVDNYGVRRAVDFFAKFHGFTITTSHQHWIMDVVVGK